MAIVKQVVPYEYLTRFSPDGRVRGQHIRYLTRIVDEETGEVYAEREGDALPVGGEKERVLLAQALGEVGARLAEDAEKALQERDQKEQALAELHAALEAERHKVAEAKAHADSLDEELRREQAKNTRANPDDE